MNKTRRYPVVEIFESVQGEGYNTGREAVFLRFGGCDLNCPWCDTDWRTFEPLDADAIAARVSAFKTKALIVTGGEPFIQDDLGPLLGRFKDLGYWIAAETNGLTAPPEDVRRRIDYLSVSPKALYADLYDDERMVRRADEVRIVADGDMEPFCRNMRERIDAAHYFLSPLARDGRFNFEETVRLLGRLNAAHRSSKWLLSLQMHKLAGFR